MTGSRYAIYFVPPADGGLYRLGSSLLGYDCYRSADVPLPGGLPGDWADMTEAPRRYGFHGTLVAPFRLWPDRHEAELVQAAAEFIATPREVATIEPVVRALGKFIAIVPRVRDARLDRLAADCVTAFDRFRAPLSAADRARRGIGLSERERANLERWGYPYVFEDFRFHMTLTGPLDEQRRRAVTDLLAARLAEAHADGPLPIDRVLLLRQDDDNGRFRVLHEALLRSKEAVES
jgi:putative phosphonate metabolism protein